MTTADPLVVVAMAGPDAVLNDPHPVFDQLLAEQPDGIRATVEESMSLLARSRLPVAQAVQQDIQPMEMGAA